MAKKVPALLGLMAMASLLLWFAGCGHYACHTTFGTATCTPSGGGIGGGVGGVTAFVYFMDDKAGQIAAAGLDVTSSQTFAPIAGFATPTLPPPPISDGGLVTVNKSYLYMPLGDGNLYAFAIDGSTGALTPLTKPTYPVAGSTIATDPAGKYLFLGEGTTITVMSVASDGSLTTVAGSPFSTGTITATQISTDGQGKYVYAVDGSGVAAFSIQSSGALTAVSGSPFTGTSFNMLEMAGEASGKFMIGVTGQTDTSSGIDNNVYLFSISSGTGALSVVGKFSTANPPAHIAVSPNGAFVYAFTQTTTGTSTTLQPIEGFQLLATGTLQTLASSPFTTLLGRIGKFEQTGQFLFTVGETTNSQAQGSLALGVNTTTGELGNTLPSTGAPSNSYAVTDAP